MKRQSFLRLAPQIDHTLRKELKFENMLIACLELSLLESMQKTIEQKQVLVLRIIRHHNHKANDPIEHVIELPIRLTLDF